MQRLYVALALALAVVSFGGVTLPSLPGLADGIRPESLPMAVVLIASTLYVASVGKWPGSF